MGAGGWRVAEYPDWMREVFASNMVYRPKSAPMFTGDLHHDIRDAFYAARGETVAMWAGWAADKYLMSCRTLGIRDDPVADSLEAFVEFDLRTMQVAHDQMAAHWRHVWLPLMLDGTSPKDVSAIPGVGDWAHRGSMSTCLAVFRNWLRINIDFAADRDPVVIRLLCLVLVQQNTAQGYMAEIDLFDALRARYPFPTIPPS